jgi:muramoyltetrapeptide carboxypeptidase LdcA involved in peptidoglycan recycling
MIIGSLTGCDPVPDRPSLQIREIVLELAQLATFPIVWNFRAGHIAGKLTLPLGLPASLNTRMRTLTIRPPIWKRLYPARGLSAAR